MPYGVITLLACVGFLETGYLTANKLFNTQVACPVGGSCSSVLTSEYSNVFGIPLSLFGMLAYGAVAYLAAREFVADNSRGQRARQDRDLARVAVLGGGAVLASCSSFLLYILFTQFSGDSCAWCLTSAGLSFSVLFAALQGFSSRELAEAAAPGGGLVAATVLGLAIAWSNVDPKKSVASTEFSLAFVCYMSWVYAQKPEVTQESPPGAVDLAKRLNAAGAKFYGAFWCSHCFDQKQVFGKEAQDDLPYVECYPQGFSKDLDINPACSAARIQNFPSWVINGKVAEGDQTFKQLEALLAQSGKP